MRFLTKVKDGMLTWVDNLDSANSMKLLIALVAAVLYMLSGMFPAIGQWLLCGVLILVSFVSFSSILLSLAGVTIKKLEPIEQVFEKLHDKWESDVNDG